MNGSVKVVVGVMLVVLAGCVAQPERMAQTPSGWPEVIIATPNKQLIKEKIIAMDAKLGWNLEQETESTVLFTKVDNSGSFGSLMTKNMLGNAYSTLPQYEMRYIFSTDGDSTHVIVNVAVSTQMPMGQVNRLFLDNNNMVFNTFQLQLNKIKDEIESRPVP